MAYRADSAALEASPIRFSSSVRRAVPLPNQQGEADPDEVDSGWVAPGQYSLKAERQSLHMHLLERELLDGGARASSTPPKSRMTASNKPRISPLRALASDGDVGAAGSGDDHILMRGGSRAQPSAAAIHGIAQASPGRATAAGSQSAGVAAAASQSSYSRLSPSKRVLSFGPSNSSSSSSSSATASSAGNPYPDVYDGGGYGAPSYNDGYSYNNNGARRKPLFSPSSSNASSSSSSLGFGLGTETESDGLQSIDYASAGSTSSSSSSSRVPSASAAAIATARRQALSSASTSLSPLTPGSQALLQSDRRPTRQIAKIPYKILDAPGVAVSAIVARDTWWCAAVVALASCLWQPIAAGRQQVHASFIHFSCSSGVAPPRLLGSKPRIGRWIDVPKSGIALLEWHGPTGAPYFKSGMALQDSEALVHESTQ